MLILSRSSLSRFALKLALGPYYALFTIHYLLNFGGQGRNRTADAGLFRAALYQLSYLAVGQERPRSIGSWEKDVNLRKRN
jgi:hypothetical protein